MKRKITLLVALTILILVMVSLVACSSKSTPSKTSAPLTTPNATTSAATTPSQTSASSVTGLLGKSAGIASMKFDMVTTGSDNSVTTSTAWVKNKKMRVENSVQGQNMVTLIDTDAKTMYLYNPAQNTAIKMDLSQAPQNPISSSISQFNPTIIGSETLDGKLCQILQYTANGVVTKEWIWDAKGLPVRTQTTSSSGTTTTDFKNYDFSDLPDNQFVLPADAKITSFGLPSGLPTDLPSVLPTNLPSGLPTSLPSGLPTNLPTGLPGQ
jgi:outer membrane lipoprotein-sorting protein